MPTELSFIREGGSRYLGNQNVPKHQKFGFNLRYTQGGEKHGACKKEFWGGIGLGKGY